MIQKSILCKIGLHKSFVIANAYEGKHHLKGQVLGCHRCGKVWKWGIAYIPDYYKK